jgi:hypothetical protein
LQDSIRSLTMRFIGEMRLQLRRNELRHSLRQWCCRVRWSPSDTFGVGMQLADKFVASTKQGAPGASLGFLGCVGCYCLFRPDPGL